MFVILLFEWGVFVLLTGYEILRIFTFYFYCFTSGRIFQYFISKCYAYAFLCNAHSFRVLLTEYL